MSFQKNIRFILFVAILHFLGGYFFQILHLGGAVAGEIEFVASQSIGVVDPGSASIKQRPFWVAERFFYKAVNLPLSLVVKGNPRGLKGGDTFFDFSASIRVGNSILAALIIYVLVQAIFRLMHFRAQLNSSSSADSSHRPIERIASHVTDEKIWRIALFPFFGKIGRLESTRSIRSDMLFVYCVISAAGLGLERILTPYSWSESANASKPVFLELLRWIMHAPLSLVLDQKAFSENLLLILLNSAVCALSIGVLRWWLKSAKKPHG